MRIIGAGAVKLFKIYIKNIEIKIENKKNIIHW
jgi:hypothetical protein